MSKQRKALEIALDTLRGWIGIDEWIWPVTAKETCKKNSLEAITAIREALAEPFDPVQDAAPDLLEALESSLEEMKDDWITLDGEFGPFMQEFGDIESAIKEEHASTKTIRMAIAAIAKAKGVV